MYNNPYMNSYNPNLMQQNINDTGEICEWESPLTTVWMPKGAYRLVGGVSSNANIVIFAYSCNV